jgi:hypothetical protein
MRILNVVVAVVSLVVLLFFLWMYRREPVKRKPTKRRGWCNCFDSTDAYASKTRASVFRPCREGGCNMARLSGMKWCVVHDRVTTYRRVQNIDAS